MTRQLLTVKNYYSAVSGCLNVILLITIFHQTLREPRSSATVSTECRPVIRSTEQSLYVMYGKGNFSDDNEHLLNYIRSMTSRQGVGGRRLSSGSARLDYSQVGGSRFVDELLQRRRDGFFVECGAFRGEHLSDTLFFEMQRNWTGILIEAHPDYHRDILTRNRRALVLRGCLSGSARPALAKFKLSGWASGLATVNKNFRTANETTTTAETDVQCFSLNSVMAAIGVHHIDLLVLDVEGAELPVLQTIDWTRLSVDVFIIEYSDRDRVSKLNTIRRFFSETRSYREVGKLPMGADDHVAQDVIFMRVNQ